MTEAIVLHMVTGTLHLQATSAYCSTLYLNTSFQTQQFQVAHCWQQKAPASYSLVSFLNHMCQEHDQEQAVYFAVQSPCHNQLAKSVK
jgi:hypothetical protein